MYNYSISKVIDGILDRVEMEKKISVIALELGIGAFGITECRIAWEADGKIEWHNAFIMKWGQPVPFTDLHVLAYLLNKTFKGAQTCITNPPIGQYFTGRRVGSGFTLDKYPTKTEEEHSCGCDCESCRSKNGLGDIQG